MKGLDRRLARLEAAAADVAARRQSAEDEPPCPAGKPLEIVRCEYIAWLLRKLAKPGLTAKEREVINQWIERVADAVQHALDYMQAQHDGGKLPPFGIELLETAEQMLAGQPVSVWPVGKVLSVWLTTAEGKRWEATAPPQWWNVHKIEPDQREEYRRRRREAGARPRG